MNAEGGPDWRTSLSPHRPADFSPEGFASPAGRFRPSYFWVWNDRLTQERIRRQLDDMHQHGVGGVCIVPEPPEFRPQLMATALEPEYLSARYFEMVRFAVEECDRLGLAFWLYDEGGWPSGSACGRVVQAQPGLANCRLQPVALPLAAADPTAVVATAWREGDTTICVPGLDREAEGRAAASAYVQVRQAERDASHPVTPDLLDPESTNAFLALTHDAYRGALEPHLGPGRAIECAFTDEPAVPPVQPGLQIPWTPDLLEVFRTEKGYDLLPHLPSLLADPATLDLRQMGVRLDYFDVWSRRFVSSYLLPIRDWCRSQGILSGGHFGGEDETDGSLRHGFGHLLRSLRTLDVPGVDAIWQQLFPGGGAHHFPKYAASVAHQQNSFAMSESFAAYGNGLTPQQMKWVIDFQWVRGINSLVAACYPFSTRNHFMFGLRPHFGPVNPLWDALSDLHDYVARLSYALATGQPGVDAAVYYPVRDIWTGLAATNGVAAAHEGLALELLAGQRDFDYVDDDILQSADLTGGTLSVGPISYSTLLLQPVHWLPRASALALRRFVAGGGHLILVDEESRCDGSTPISEVLGVGLEPGLTVALEAGRVSLLSRADAVSRLLPLLTARPSAPWLRACRRDCPSGRLYFLVNESDAAVATDLYFPEATRPIRLRPETGDLEPLAFAEHPGDGIALPVSLLPYESLLVWFPTRPPATGPTAAGAAGLVAELAPAGSWTLRPRRRYFLTEAGPRVEALTGEAATPVELGDWRRALGDGFSGHADYSVEFILDGQPRSEPWIDLGEVRHVAEAWLNGVPLGRRSWLPYRFSAPSLRRGRNRLRVRVTNTLADAIVSEEGEALAHARGTPGWPGPYDARARAFEREARGGGLIGPVTLGGGY